MYRVTKPVRGWASYLIGNAPGTGRYANLGFTFSKITR
jgi:hypothetical protein